MIRYIALRVGALVIGMCASAVLFVLGRYVIVWPLAELAGGGDGALVLFPIILLPAALIGGSVVTGMLLLPRRPALESLLYSPGLWLCVIGAVLAVVGREYFPLNEMIVAIAVCISWAAVYLAQQLSPRSARISREGAGVARSRPNRPPSSPPTA